MSRRHFGNWHGTRRGGAIAIPWSTWRIRSDRRAGCERDHDPTGQLLPDRRRPMRRARKRLSRYHRLDPLSRSSAARSNGASSMSAATTRTIGPPSCACAPRLWHADFGTALGPHGMHDAERSAFRERLERSQTADCHRRPARMRYRYFLGVKWVAWSRLSRGGASRWFALPRTTTPLKAGIESYDTRQRLRDRCLGKN